MQRNPTRLVPYLAVALLCWGCGSSTGKRTGDNGPADSSGAGDAGTEAALATSTTGASSGGNGGDMAGSGSTANAGASSGGASSGGASAVVDGASATGSAGSGGSGASTTGGFPFGFSDPEELVTGLTNPTRIELRDGVVYFTEAGLVDTGEPSRVARATPTGEVETLFEGNDIRALHLDESELFFVERSSNTVYRMGHDDAEPSVFAVTSDWAVDVERRGDAVWMTLLRSDPPFTALTTQNIDGTETSTISSMDNATFFFTYMTSYQDTLYITTVGSGLFKIPAMGNGGVTVPNVVSGHIAASATHVYFAATSGEILRQAHGVDQSPETLAEGRSNLFAVGVDDDGVYWTEGPDCAEAAAASGSIMGRALDGGEPTRVAGPTRCPVALVSDANHVYWASAPSESVAGSGAIWRVEKQR